MSVTDYFRWELNDETANHCAACRHYNGQVKSAEEWDVIASPPYHPNCGCRLVFDHTSGTLAPDFPPTPSQPPYIGRGQTGSRPNNPNAPPAIDGTYPVHKPNVIQTGPSYPPQTPASVVVTNPPPVINPTPSTTTTTTSRPSRGRGLRAE